MPVEGGTNPDLTLAHVQASDAGSYFVRVSHSLGSLSSGIVSLTIKAGPRNGILVLNTLDQGSGSLRQAILDANRLEGTNVIVFQIAGAAIASIRPTSPLPAITDSVVIDGATQPGFTGSPVVELRGDQAGPAASGLILRAPSVIRGLAINGWQGNGIELDAPGGHVIQGNYIGVNPAGSAAVANGGAGVLISSSSNNQVGGEEPGEGNVISGNGQSGVNLNINGSLNPAQPTSGNVIQGNRIGVSADGAAALRNGGSGILIYGDCSNTLIGGTNALAGNTISGNAFNGVEIVANASDTVVLGNRIGTDHTGAFRVPNLLDGVLISGAGTGLYPLRTLIGDTNAGGGNVISGNNYSGIEIDGRNTGTQILGNFIGTDFQGNAALGNIFAGIFVSQEASANAAGTRPLSILGNMIAYNLEAGVDVQDRRSPSNPYNTGILIRQNSIFSNTLLGIDLQPTGLTANDTGDADVGANNRQNYPVLTNVVVSVEGIAVIQGRLNSRANLTYTLDFYANAQCDASGAGEGQTWLASVTVKTDATGNVLFSAEVGALPAGQKWITATATDSSQNTSEFSACVAAPP